MAVPYLVYGNHTPSIAYFDALNATDGTDNPKCHACATASTGVIFSHRITKQDTAMKLRNLQRKMLKKAIKGVKKGALPFVQSPSTGEKIEGSEFIPGKKGGDE
jgi:hypothetical protein